MDATDFRNNFIDILNYIALVPLWSNSNKDKNQEDLKNGIIKALKITNQNNLLTIAFPPLGNGVFGFSTDLCATNQVRTLTRVMIANNL